LCGELVLAGVDANLDCDTAICCHVVHRQRVAVDSYAEPAAGSNADFTALLPVWVAATPSLPLPVAAAP
jgi:hypothetical protein